MDNAEVPIADDAPPDNVRAPREVATRALALFGAIGVALGAPRGEVVPWLRDHGLWNELAPSEAEFLFTPGSDDRARINFGWQSERLLVLLWALGRVAVLPAGNVQCDTSQFHSILPPYAKCTVAEFLDGATLLGEDMLFAKADELLDQHWQARDVRLKGNPSRKQIDIEIVQERHHAINWIIGYCGLSWDEVTTDT